MINGGTSTAPFLAQSISNTRIAVVKGFGGTPQLLLNHLCPATVPSSPHHTTSELLF
ncbi:hypothetical protein AB3S75_003277 [Citrus x aurantiifolia]